jgi:L-threonylcarbamoyladenylate synthase
LALHCELWGFEVKRADCLLPSGDWISKVIEFFKKHEPVALPTETVYGLAAPVSDLKAVARIYEIKERPSFNPLILHVKEDWDLSKWADCGETEKRIIEKFWPGPLSLLLPKKNISDLVTAGSPKVVVRAPSNKIFRELLDKIKEPLVAPSANSSSLLSPTTADAVVEDLSVHGLVAVIEGGQTQIGIESTIIEIKDGFVTILREGAVTKEDFEKAGFTVVLRKPESIVPGSQTKHYAPIIPLLLFELEKDWASKDSETSARPLWVKVLKMDAPDFLPSGEEVYCLAEDNDLKTAAHNLFEFLRMAQKKFTALHVLKTKEVGLGRAINDRLLRASER